MPNVQKELNRRANSGMWSKLPYYRKPDEPSMEDILASIRRILAEEKEDRDPQLRLPLKETNTVRNCEDEEALMREWAGFTEEDGRSNMAAEWEAMMGIPEAAESLAKDLSHLQAVLNQDEIIGCDDRDSTSVLNQDEIDSLLGYRGECDLETDEDIMKPKPLTSNETPPAWSFKSDAVAKKFEDHVREQLPWYDPLSQFVADIAVSFLPTNGVLYDIGASTGNMTKLLAHDIEAKKVRAVSVEPSHQMAHEWHGVGDLVVIEAERINFANDRPDVVTMFLMLMFMRPAEREKFLRDVCRAITPGGALLLVDKGYLRVPQVQVACKSAQLAGKRRDGTPADAYITKELALRGEQRPTDQRLVYDIGESEGFVVEEIFRFGEFYGLLLVKRCL